MSLTKILWRALDRQAEFRPDGHVDHASSAIQNLGSIPSTVVQAVTPDKLASVVSGARTNPFKLVALPVSLPLAILRDIAEPLMLQGSVTSRVVQAAAHGAAVLLRG